MQFNRRFSTLKHFLNAEDEMRTDYLTYIPVETEDEVETLKAASPLGLLDFSPRLQRDFPKDAKSQRCVG
jgi:hypothetical protein